jgi:hypothetical protein
VKLFPGCGINAGTVKQLLMAARSSKSDACTGIPTSY